MLKRLLAVIVISAITAIGVFAIQVPAHANPVTGLTGPYTIHPTGDVTKCLDVTGAYTYEGIPLQIYDCLGSQQYNQIFYFWPVPGTRYYQITPAHSWKCLDVQGASQQNGALIQQWNCLGYNQWNQIWDVYEYGYGYVTIAAVHSWKCLSWVNLANNSLVFQEPPYSYWYIYNA